MSSHTTSETLAAAAGTIRIGDDLTVNRMGFGAMRLTGRGIWGPPADRPEAIRVLRRAIELGVDFIDTADSYGPGVSEEIIAEALHPYPDGLVIATKGGLQRPGPDKWVTNGRPDYLRRRVESSLRRLKLDRIDLWQLHRIDPKVPENEQFEVMREFQREGLVRHLGLSEIDGGALLAAPSTRHVFAIATATAPSLPGDPDPGTGAIERAAALAGGIPSSGGDDLRDAHETAHRALYDRCALELPGLDGDLDTAERVRRAQERDDPALAALVFHYGRYLLMASSQPGGLPATLQEAAT